MTNPGSKPRSVRPGRSVIGGERWISSFPDISGPKTGFLGFPGSTHSQFASGRDALHSLLRETKPSVVFVPDFGCGSITRAVVSAGAKPAFFPAQESLHVLPEEALESMAGKPVIVPHYFGVINTGFIRQLNTIGARAISDVTHVLLDTAAMDQMLELSDFVFGSYRKTLPIADGGFLASRKYTVPLPEKSARANFAALRFAGLHSRGLSVIGGFHNTENLRLFELAERQLEESHPDSHAMSHLGQAALESFEVQAEVRSVAENTRFLKENLSAGISTPTPLDSLSPLFFLLFDDRAAALAQRAKLSGRNIFLPQHWPEIEKVDPEHFSLRSLSVPVDSRYDCQDMARLLEELAE